MFERVLVANRGEIARRIVRTCRRLGIATVAVHSDADASEPHVREADAAVRLGPPPATDSYLDVDAVVRAAVTAGADAVHPGYGFLAEHAGLADAVAAAGLTFVGPSPDAIRLMGDKAAAKRRLAAVGVPVIPGLEDADLDDAGLRAAADDLGVPLLVKAVAGGGGKGMRTVTDLAHLADAVTAARREAAAAFGDDRLILERLVPSPRHIEVQVLGDQHGHVVHLFERECSVQRRHQKLVEETPSPAVDTDLRARMTAAAVTAAKAVDYTGAGTVEFLVDGQSLATAEPTFYFLEMNTRLQVEHPVTEAITGLDLVELQLRVAAGEPLGFSQEEVALDGHALEVRLYAEDPVDHLPQTGTVHAFAVPEAPDVRVDSGIEAGSEVTRFYDPMLAKLIVHTPDRSTSCRRMQWVLSRTTLHGVTTNLDLLAAVVGHDAFVAGELTTGFLPDHLAGWSPPATPEVAFLAAAVALQLGGRRQRLPGDPHRPWDTLGPFRPGLVGGWQVELDDGAEAVAVRLAGRAGRYRAALREQQHDLEVLAGPDASGHLHLEVDGVETPALVTVVTDPDAPTMVWVHAAAVTRRIAVVPATRHTAAGALTGPGRFTSPMPGAVLDVRVDAGDHVPAGATLVVVEAMKMEHPIVAPADGEVTAVHVVAGQPVEAGTLLVSFEPDDDPAGR